MLHLQTDCEYSYIVGFLESIHINFAKGQKTPVKNHFKHSHSG